MEKIQNPVELEKIPDLEIEIERCAKYLVENECVHQRLDSAQYGFSDFQAELDLVKRDIDRALKRLDKLAAHFESGLVLTDNFTKLDWSSPGRLKSLGMEPFMRHQERLLRARQFALDALVEMTIMISEVRIFHVQKTRALSLQKSAARLAYAAVGDRIKGQVRQVAKRIMDKANLGNPHPSSLSGWLKEFKDRDEK